MVKVLFFASLREQLKCEKCEVTDFKGQSIEELRTHLLILNPHWHNALMNQQLLSAVNQTLAPMNTQIKENDEIAFFPKVTGG